MPIRPISITQQNQPYSRTKIVIWGILLWFSRLYHGTSKDGAILPKKSLKPNMCRITAKIRGNSFSHSIRNSTPNQSFAKSWVSILYSIAGNIILQYRGHKYFCSHSCRGLEPRVKLQAGPLHEPKKQPKGTDELSHGNSSQPLMLHSVLWTALNRQDPIIAACRNHTLLSCAMKMLLFRWETIYRCQRMYIASLSESLFRAGRSIYLYTTYTSGRCSTVWRAASLHTVLGDD
jgi:hypothetical protein